MKKILLLAFTASVMLGACKKSNDEPKEEQVEEGCPVQSFSFVETYGSSKYENGPYAVTYDTKGNITSITEDGYKIEYSYGDGFILEDKGHGEALYTLDAQGRISGMTSSYTNGTPNGAVTVKYNAEGYISELKYEDSNYKNTTTFIYSNGELTNMQESYVSNSSSVSSSTDITYKDEVSKNSLAYAETFPYIADISTGGDTRMYLNVLGKKKKRLINSVVRKRGNQTSTRSYSYEKDEKGNVTKVNIVAVGDNAFTSKYDFQYDCK